MFGGSGGRVVALTGTTNQLISLFFFPCYVKLLANNATQLNN